MYSEQLSKLLTIAFFVFTTLLFMVFTFSHATFAQQSEVDIRGGLCSGASFELNTDCNSLKFESSEQLTNYIAVAINLFTLFVGILAVVMIIIGGVKYITSGGDAGNVTGAKNTILYAIIGLVIVALSQVIVQFVLGSFSEV